MDNKVIYAFGKNVATEPFQDREVKTENRGGFAVVSQKHNLTPLKVLFGNEEGRIDAGDVVWVSSEMMKAHWAMKEFTVKNYKFILVPEDAVQLVEKDVASMLNRATSNWTLQNSNPNVVIK